MKETVLREFYHFTMIKPKAIYANQPKSYLKFVVEDPKFLARIYGDTAGDHQNIDIPKTVIFHKHIFDKQAYVIIDKFIGYGIDNYKKFIIGSTLNAGQIRIDSICSICGHGWYNIPDKYDGFKVLQLEQNLVNFYNMYGFRCPNPSDPNNIFHIYKKDKCVNCGITAKIITDKNLQYYNKYKSKRSPGEVVTKVKEIKFQPVIAENDVSTVVPVDKIYNIYSGKLKKEQFRNMFVNIGLNEQQQKDDVLDGLLVDAEKAQNQQTLSIHLLIYALLTRTQIIVNFNNFAKLPLWFQDLQENLSSKDVKLLKTLDYKEPYLHQRNTYKNNSEALNLFTMGYFADLMEFILNCKIPVIVEYFCKFVVDYEISLFAPSKDKVINSAAGIQTTNPNMVDNRFTKDFDDLVPADKLEEYGYSDMDYEGENDDF